MLGNKWVKNKAKDHYGWIDNFSGMKCIKPTMEPSTMIRVLENCIQLGYPIILEDAGETFDPLLDPLIGK